MRKAILMMLLVGVSGSAAAEWVYIGSHETFATYVDPVTLRKAGNMVKMWGLSDYKTARVLLNGKPYLSARAQTEYDCKEERARLLSVSWHTGNMAEGEVVLIESGPSIWDPVAPGSLGETLWNIACGKR